MILPPGLPFVPGFSFIPLRLRFTNYALIALVAYGLYAFGFTLLESLVIACFWMILGGYLVLDYLYDLPLAA